MEWLYYLLEANLYLLLFYAFYSVALQQQTFYNNNRFYLLASSITSFLIPLTQLGFLKPAPVIDQLVYIQPAQIQENVNYDAVIYSIYVIISIGFAVKLSTNLIKIIRLWLKAKKTSRGKITLIELEEQSTAFSFFNLLFIHPNLAGKPTVLKHEMVHIEQKHSFDILFFEILQIICWFNPIIYFIKRDIKLLHEFIADEESTSSETDKHAYAMFLIENSFGTSTTPLANQFFNQSILKRRINMLNKKKSGSWSQLRLVLALPLTGIMLCASTLAFSKDYGYFDLLPEKSNVMANVQQEVRPVKKAKTEKDQVKFPPPIVKPDGKNLKTAPPVEPPPPSYRIKKDQVKFPPPIVKPDVKNQKKSSAGYQIKEDQVKFPPPVVKRDVEVSSKTVEGEPIKKPELPEVKIKAVQPKSSKENDDVKFPPPIVKPDKKAENNIPSKTDVSYLKSTKTKLVAKNRNNISELKLKQAQQKKEALQTTSIYRKVAENKSASDKLIKLYNASKFQTIFYPSKINKEEVGC